jgi:nucleoside-diphosphate-sugar epimerase
VRVFLAGATGVMGRRLVPMLLADGHQVTGMTRSREKLEQLRASGAEPVLADALDAAAVHDAVAQARPEAVIHQLTALPSRIDPRKIERDFALNDRLRDEGTRILVGAAQAAGATRILAQSIAFSYAPGPPGAVHREQDPLLKDPPKSFKRSAEAMQALERTVLGAGGMVLRYGYFYGPGSAMSRSGSIGQDLARRRLPIVAAGTRRRARRAPPAAGSRHDRAPAGGRLRRGEHDPSAGRQQRVGQARAGLATRVPQLARGLSHRVGLSLSSGSRADGIAERVLNAHRTD